MKMKTELTTEQSQHLIELGVPIKYCTGEVYAKQLLTPNGGVIEYKLFTLADLLGILPNKILYNHDDCFLMIIRDVYGNYTVGYAFETFDGPIFCNYCEFGGELIDALYELTVWCLENGYIKKDYNEVFKKQRESDRFKSVYVDKSLDKEIEVD